MRRFAIALLLAGSLVPGTCRAAGAMKPETTHSGRIVATDPGAKTIALEELGTWTPKSRPMRRVIELTPDTRIELVTRSTDAAPGQWPGGFTETPLAATALKPGEFATVKTTTHDGRLIAVEVTVVSPTPAPSATTREPRGATAARGQ